MKRCPSCKKNKITSSFSTNKLRKDGLCFYCKKCIKKKQVESYKKHRVKRVAAAGKWYRENKEKALAIKKRWKQKNKEKVALYQLKRLYGLSEEEYKTLIKNQRSKCGICGINEKKLGAKLDVDHDHRTGAVRGLLCNRCNTALGRLGDSIKSIKKVLKYLSQSKKRAKDVNY